MLANGVWSSPGGSTKQLFSVVMEGSDGAMSQLELGRDALRLWSVLGDESFVAFPLEQIDSWWYSDNTFFFSILTADGEREVALISPRAPEIMEAMQACVDDVLLARQRALAAREATVAPPLPTAHLHGPSEVRRGWLAKRRNTFPRTWQKRFFVLATEGDHHILKYFTHESKEEDKPLGSIDLSVFSVLAGRMLDEPLLIAFEAWQTNKARRRKFLLLAEDRPQREAWAKALNRAAMLDDAAVEEADSAGGDSSPLPVSSGYSLGRGLSGASRGLTEATYTDDDDDDDDEIYTSRYVV